MTLAEEMIAFRAENNVSQAELGRRCGLNRSEILYLENGRHNPRKTTEHKIRKVINKEETDNDRNI